MVQIKNPVTIVQGSGPTPPTPTSQDIRFYDIDGTLVESWSLAELQNKTALPANPTAPTGLTAKGWNWTLQELKTENAPMNVGQLYAPTDGKTHLFVEVDADHLQPNLAIGVNGTAIVDWGDGSATTTFTGSDLDVGQNEFHTYSQAGSYEVTIEIPTGSAGRIRGNTNYVSFLWKGEASQQGITIQNLDYAQQAKVLWLGERMDISSYGGLHLLGIETLVIPDYYPSSALDNFCVGCPNLSSAIVIPPTVTNVGSGFLSNCSSFNQPIALPSTVSSYIYSNFLSGCSSFNQPITLPTTVTIITSNFLSGCVSFNQPITIPSVVSIGDYFLSNCSSFNQPITISSTATDVGVGFLTGCASFSQPITLPATVTVIGGNFLYKCYGFSSLVTETTASPTDTYSLSSDEKDAKIYVKGVTITGSGATSWITNLQDRTVIPYRRLINGNT